MPKINRAYKITEYIFRYTVENHGAGKIMMGKNNFSYLLLLSTMIFIRVSKHAVKLPPLTFFSFLLAVPQKGYGMEDGAFCGVYDGHGRYGHIVSKMVNSHLPSLILSQKNAPAEINKIENGDDNTPSNFNTVEDDLAPKNFQKWKRAIVSAFMVMDKQVKLQENLDCSCSGTTAVVVIRQVNKINTQISLFIFIFVMRTSITKTINRVKVLS